MGAPPACYGDGIVRPVLASATVVASVLGLTYAACSVYGTDLVGGGNDAGTDSGTADVADAGAPGCGHAKPPSRPTTDDPGGAETQLVAAATSVDFGLDAGASRSFDLDDQCTCPDKESCKPQAGAQPHCDDDAGRDNTGGPLLGKFVSLSPAFNFEGLNGRINEGANTLLFRVRHWNGLANDTSVELAIFLSRTTAPLDDAGTHPLPKHDGNDLWSVDSASLVGGIAPPYVPTYVDGNAYVSGGVVVGTLDFPLALGGAFSGTFISLSGARVLGQLDKRPTGYALKDARVVGRWGTRNLLTGMQVVTDPLNPGEFLCGNNPTYQTIKSEICKSADLTTVPQNDNSGAACDAMSLVLSFQSEPALLGPVALDNSDAGILAPCGVSYTDQCGQ